MSRTTWQSTLTTKIEALGAARIAVLGVGHELRGDDAVGCHIVRVLQDVPWSGDKRWLLLEGGAAPENQTGALQRFAPDVVLMIDAAQMGEAPGTISLLRWQETGSVGFSTHAVSLSLVASYLVAELGCKVLLMGIEPASLALGAALSAPVASAVEEIVAGLADL